MLSALSSAPPGSPRTVPNCIANGEHSLLGTVDWLLDVAGESLGDGDEAIISFSTSGGAAVEAAAVEAEAAASLAGTAVLSGEVPGSPSEVEVRTGLLGPEADRELRDSIPSSGDAAAPSSATVQRSPARGALGEAPPDQQGLSFDGSLREIPGESRRLVDDDGTLELDALPSAVSNRTMPSRLGRGGSPSSCDDEPAGRGSDQ